MKRFALIGAAGYIAPKHVKAIHTTNNDLVAVLDPHDSVGYLDSYFPNAKYFKEFERFDRYLEKIKSEGRGIDYLSICSPNYLHDAHCRLALRLGADAICEKPLVLNVRNLESLESLEKTTGKKVYSILQLRLHEEVKKLKQMVVGADSNKRWNVILVYTAPRGAWYKHSWKGNLEMSGGLVTNIGIHLFDMLGYIFGGWSELEMKEKDKDTVVGRIKYERADVTWCLSIAKAEVMKPFRLMIVDTESYSFNNITDLHTESYKQILEGKGFGIEEARQGIDIVEKLRGM